MDKNDINGIVEKLVKKYFVFSERQKIDNEKKELEERHNNKPHIMPSEYRLFYGFLHAINIQYGSFLEELLKELLEKKGYTIHRFSGHSSEFKELKDNVSLIDAYISEAKNNKDFDETKYNNLIDEIKSNIKTFPDNKYTTSKYDCDILFFNKDEKYYYIEVKNGDNHDSSKGPDIPRKLLKTYACLLKELNGKELIPILYFFTKNDKRQISKYLKNDENIYRGEKFFEKFFGNAKMYDDVVEVIERYGNKDLFDELNIEFTKPNKIMEFWLWICKKLFPNQF